MKIAMGNDHTAIELKNIIKELDESKVYEVIDLRTNSTESSEYNNRYIYKICNGKFFDDP